MATEPPLLVAWRSASAGFEEEPASAFSFVDPVLDEARGSDVAMLVANLMRLAQPHGQGLIVFAKFGKHIERLNVIRVIVEYALLTRDLTDRSKGGATDLPHAFRYVIGHAKELVGLLVEQQMIIAEMGSAHVPVKVLGLEVEREDVRQDRIHCAGNVFRGFRGKVGARRERSLLFAGQCFERRTHGLKICRCSPFHHLSYRHFDR